MTPIWLITTIPAILFSMFAQWKMKSTFEKYSKVFSDSNLTGLEAGNIIIKNEDLDVKIESIDGELTDHYDSSQNIMRVSNGTKTNSVAAIAIVAHELGHALQDKHQMSLFTFRNAIVPVINVGSNLGYFMILAGFIFNYLNLTYLGIIFFSLTFVFALITLPIEVNASNRAMLLIQNYNLLSVDQMKGARAVLNAAALTYVAGLSATLLQLLYFVLEANRRR
jgi:Zn-dependent membrane protease YugP